MRNGIGIYLAGLIGVFAVSWFAGRSISAIHEAPRPLDSKPEAAQTTVSARAINPHESSPTEPLRGDALQAELREVSSLVDKLGNDKPAYLQRAYQLAKAIPPKEFAHALDSLRDIKARGARELREELLAFWMEQDARGARAYFVALPRKEREDLVRFVSDAWARVDAEGLLTWLKGLPEVERGTISSSVSYAVAGALSQRDPALALSVLSEANEGQLGGNGTAAYPVFREWARRNPLEAAARIIDLPPGNSRDSSIDALMEEWVYSDPTAAKEWLLQIENSDLLQKAAIALSENLAKIDPEATLKFLVEQNLVDAAGTALLKASRNWFSQDATRALNWARSLGESRERDIILSTMLAQYATQDPQRAGEFFLETVSPQARDYGATAGLLLCKMSAANRLDLVNTFLHKLPEAAHKDAAISAAWNLVDLSGSQSAITAGLQLPSGAARQQWMKTTFESITQLQGLLEAERMLDQIPPGRERETLIAAVIQKGLSRDPDEAVSLANKIPNGRENILAAIPSWLDSGRSSTARSWIANTSFLSHEEKKELLKPKRPAGALSTTSDGKGIPRP